ncbi:MAG: hypothetical protein H0U74_16070 [Bradymonadaceae bacterium]|nr:hypothetical protein [Lujinxingiaceae bacterium]
MSLFVSACGTPNGERADQWPGEQPADPRMAEQDDPASPPTQEPAPGLSQEEIDRMQREITLQYQQLDHTYQVLDQMYEIVQNEGIVEAPESLLELHGQLAMRHQMLAQIHTDRRQVANLPPEFVQNDMEMAELNRALAQRHAPLADQTLIQALPADIVPLREELMFQRQEMMDLHYPQGFPEEPAFEDDAVPPPTGIDPFEDEPLEEQPEQMPEDEQPEMDAPEMDAPGTQPL